MLHDVSAGWMPAFLPPRRASTFSRLSRNCLSRWRHLPSQNAEYRHPRYHRAFAKQAVVAHWLCRQARAAVLVHLVHEFARTGPTIGAEALAGALRVSADGRREAALDSLPGPRRRRKVRPAPVVVVIAWDTGFTRSSRTALATPASSGTRSVVMNMQITSAEKTKWRP